MPIPMPKRECIVRAKEQVVARKVEPVVGPNRDALALRLYKSGMTYRQVGEKIGVSQSRARELCLRELRRPAWEQMMAKKTYDCDVFAVVIPERKHIEYMTKHLWDAENYISHRKGKREIIRGTFRPNPSHQGTTHLVRRTLDGVVLCPNSEAKHGN